ncbi:type II toxin-antitoxin system VapC family toxin [Thermococcus aciditolerans]|uniref:Type II toxin-antitoxin system VapC family toxin n=1 Tax=Thermococcus aciditolerans TaxID=2598455 RepID=A0A5C0SMM9_9EURY|nr:type II toxin-antitoxin system VapC family toxin [Thermococcus aciditolerans]QEK15651.1 type II toxin-antitoxin system VapC family toxin [Thermococcus aciditolerans]
MKVVLDTNAFNNWKFLKWLKSSNLEPVINTVVYTEYLYHTVKKVGNFQIALENFETLLWTVGVDVVSFDVESARFSAKSALGRWDFSKNARDYMIGALALKLNAPLITYNKKHFGWLPEVFTPEEAMERFGK